MKLNLFIGRLACPVVLLALVPRALPAESAAPGFVDASASLGVIVAIQGTEREDWGFGCAFVDYDGDGDVDLYVATNMGSPNQLFRQEAGGQFVDVAAAAGVADMRDGRAVKFADYDNDGDQDFFLGNYAASNCLYRNNGDGTFTDVADSAIASGNLTFGAAWGDLDADGWLDLYVVNRRSGRDEGINQFYHNRGDGTFVERAHELGIDDEKAGLEAVWLDYDNDGDVDLYLSNDKWGGNRLWRNNGDGTLTDVSFESRSDVTMNSMGVAVGDYDDNGYVDIYLTNTPEPTGIRNVLLRNNGDGTFDNVATAAGVFGGRYAWGTAFLDYDNDGDLDLYVVNWDLQPGDIAGKNQFFRNNGDGTFTDIADLIGAGDANPGYGLCVGDFDDDGYTDMFVSNNTTPSVLYRNTGGGGGWLKVRTVGSESNRDGIGARVRVVTGSYDQICDIDGGTSYLAHNLKEARFGVGAVGAVDTLEVRWPSGWVDRFAGVATSQTFTVIEGMTEPVVVTTIAAAVAGDGVHVSWDVNRDVIVQGFRVYRDDVLLNAGALIGKSARDYMDASQLAPDTEYEYVVAAVLDGGGEVRSDAVAVRTPPPVLGLEQNYPNPFNPGTTISFVLPLSERARLSIYDGAGRLVEVLVDADLGPGPHDYTWLGIARSGHPVASGVYFYRLETASGILTRKMVHLK